ncbi:leukocyte immunoglobulin-like receptor subfamily A member 6 [Ovis canadensis]|uniref:leukocyte immunoglobulin-like receptor subfamily A member 6 n=1 Tax=Ovis canadensis TaxID=37174 RepID=UPI00374FF5EC
MLTAFVLKSGPQPHFLEGLSLTTSPFSISEATAQPECGIMSMVFPSLLCLGLCLSQSTWAQKGNLRPPRITALPGSTVPPKSHVTLLCQGPGQAEGYKISKVGSPEPTDKEEQITPRKTNTLSIAEMTMDKTGLYHCSYQRGGRWSQFSDPLQLVMTGAYPKPSLSSVAGTVAAPGKNVKLQCFSKITHDVFILTKDGDHITQNQSSAPQDRGHQTIFLLNPVSSTQAGTYRCYGAFRDNPYVWCQPSDPLQLQVEGTTESPSSTQHRRSTAPAAWHPSLETQVRLSLAALLLLAMVVLLAEAWCSRGGGPSRRQGSGWVTHPTQQGTRFLWNLKQRTRGSVDESSPKATAQLPVSVGHSTEQCVLHQRSGAEAGGQPERGVMSVVTTSLLCLGLCLSQSTWAQKGNLRPPRITALPGFTVPCKGHVTLLCQGPGQAEGYEISKVGSPEPTDKEEQITPRKTNTLNITEITTDKTGLYHCSYQREGRWSQFSDPLQLVMTGAYEKPSLSSLAGTVAAPGENVKLQCFSKINHDVFILTKDGDHITQNQSSALQDRRHRTIFLLSPVSSTQAGTYRCYGAFRDNPYVWSHPSDPLQLQVEAPSGDLASRGRPLGIWIGVPVAVGLLLLVFLIFLILYCLRKAKSNAARKERQPEAAGRANGQVSEAADPQEVTYSQVTCRVPHQGTAGAPSREPRQTQSSEYVTLAFR